MFGAPLNPTLSALSSIFEALAPGSYLAVLRLSIKYLMSSCDHACRKEKKRKEKKRKEKKRKEKKRKEKKRKEKKRKEKKTPFGVNLMRSQVYHACSLHAVTNAGAMRVTPSGRHYLC